MKRRAVKTRHFCNFGFVLRAGSRFRIADCEFEKASSIE